MGTGEWLERAGLLLTRLVVVSAALLGFFLLAEGVSPVQKLFGLVLVLVGLYLIYHNSVVISRGSMRSDYD